MNWTIAFALAAFGLSSCAPPSNTPEGFTAKTDIPLCKEARVVHVNKNDPARTSGFVEVYQARVKMSERCAKDFYRDLERSTGTRCPPQGNCQMLSRRGPSITVVRLDGEYEIFWVG
ncbi:MAG: hypothetical protein QOJ91_2527 [Sphingomonadales bacterium]|jgi:hypothetical protein|nr:hypothetical protein [Sphingomonadales bacterium]